MAKNKNIKSFRWSWSFTEVAEKLWSRLAQFTGDVYYKSHDSFNFNIDRYSFISEYSRSIGFLFPILDENYCVAFHVTERQWVCPPSKANEHLKACINRISRIYTWEKRKIKAITIVMFGNYTKNVREGQLTHIAREMCRKRGLTTNVKVFVFTGRGTDVDVKRKSRGEKRDVCEDLINKAFEKIIWFIKRRYAALKESCTRRGINPYGIVKERLEVLKYIIEGLSLLFSKEVPWVVARRLVAGL